MERLKTILNEIPDYVINNVLLFQKLDKEYKYNAQNNRIVDGKMFSIKHIKDKSWLGLWYRATGIDELLYINWLYAGLQYDEYRDNLIQSYLRAHPKEKYIPYSIAMADRDLKKILKNNIISSL